MISFRLMILVFLALRIKYILSFHNYSPPTKSIIASHSMISRTHEKALARVARLKEKEKELNRLKTHYGKDYKQYLKLKKNVVPSVMPPSKHMSQRKIGIQRKVTDISGMKKIVSPPSREDISQLLSYPLVQVVANSSTNKKADYISGIYIGHLTSIADFLLIVEGNNKPHLQALVDDIERNTKCYDIKPPSIQGKASSGWILMDYGRLMVNIMSPIMRNFYKLEERWKDGVNLSLHDHFISSNDPSYPDGAASAIVDPDDPFWS